MTETTREWRLVSGAKGLAIVLAVMVGFMVALAIIAMLVSP
ncbi:hypothetical protein [Nocardiopsis gilva]|nr:hypothetical protein [Nocardiopsis gilva]